jgi:hypothetical protein
MHKPNEMAERTRVNQMADYEQKVFISYAWGEDTSEREAIVNQLDQSLQRRGLKIIRDKRDLGYKGSIRKFMERIGEGDIIIVVISDKYLRSKNCMYELVQIAKNKQFVDRVFPIVLSDAKIYDAGDRLDYVEHWEKEKARLNTKIRELSDFSNLDSIQQELNDVDDFRDEIDELAGLLKDMNTLNPSMHRDSDFSELFTAIEKRMKDFGAKVGSAIEDKSQVVSAVPAGRKPMPVGVLVGAAAVLLVVAAVAFSALRNRGSNVAPMVETAEPSDVATLTAVPTQAAVEATATVEPTATFTPPPTNTPEPVIEPTATPAPISMNCIHEQVWKPASTDQNGLDSISENSKGCYSMEALGIFTDANGILHLNNRGQRNAITSGIYTTVNSDSVIEFKIFVTGMYIVNTTNPVVVNFAVAPLDDVLTARNTARFKLQVETNDTRPIIYFVLADVNENTGTRMGTQHYEYGRTYTIRLELVGNSMKVYINGRKMTEELLIPTGQKAFYIGYTLPIAAGVDAEVKDITIDGVAR